MSILSHEQIALLTDYDPAASYSTAYHTIYHNIRFSWDSEQAASDQRTILFVAPASFTGQATAPTNLAIAAAQNGIPTILVDADLHTPGLLQRFSIDTQGGLSDLLLRNTVSLPDLSQVLNKTFIPDLYLLGAGTAIRQPTEIRRFLSLRLSAVIESLREYLRETESRPGLIIFHCPPVLSGPDAALISTHMDQTFLTIAAGRTTRTQAIKAKEQFERAHIRLTGAIMLNV